MFKNIADSKLTAFVLLLLALSLLAVSIYSRRPSRIPEELYEDRSAVQKAAELGLVSDGTIEVMSAKAIGWTQGDNPFFTTYFKPPPKPEPKPAKDRKVSLLFQGYFASSKGTESAFIQVDDKTVVAGLSSVIVDDYALAQLNNQQATLTNSAGAEMLLPFRKPVTLTLPPEEK